MGKTYLPLSEKEEYLGREIVDAAYKVHKMLGPGLLERVYEACFCYELAKKKMAEGHPLCSYNTWK